MSSSKKAHARVNDIGGNSVVCRPSLLVSVVCMEFCVRQRAKLCATKNTRMAIGYYDKNQELSSLSDLSERDLLSRTQINTQVLVVIVFFIFH